MPKIKLSEFDKELVDQEYYRDSKFTELQKKTLKSISMFGKYVDSYQEIIDNNETLGCCPVCEAEVRNCQC